MDVVEEDDDDVGERSDEGEVVVDVFVRSNR